MKQVPDPQPGPDEVLVDVVSTALNRADLLQRLGLYRAPDPQPQFEIPGLEFAGRVAACGERVIRWSVGDAVMGIVGGGGYAERIAVHERQCLPVPSTVPLADAGGIPEVWITAHDALHTQGGLQAGDAVLIHGGASGVGTAAIQLARRAHASSVTSLHRPARSPPAANSGPTSSSTTDRRTSSPPSPNTPAAAVSTWSST